MESIEKWLETNPSVDDCYNIAELVVLFEHRKPAKIDEYLNRAYILGKNMARRV